MGAFAIDPDALLEAFKTNSVGPALVSQVALPFLEKGSAKKILHISSTSGSIGSADEMGAVMAGYSMTKSALNMLVRPRPVVLHSCGFRCSLIASARYTSRSWSARILPSSRCALDRSRQVRASQ